MSELPRLRMMRPEVRYTVSEEHKASLQHDLRKALKWRMRHSGGHPKWCRSCQHEFEEGDFYARIPMMKTGRHYTYYCETCANALTRSLR